MARPLLLGSGVKLLLALAITATGCAVDAPVGFGDDLGTPENPVPSEDAYAVQTRMQLAFDSPALTAAIGGLRAFSQAPAHALLAPTGTLPAWVSTLSSTLRTNLEGYLNTELDKVKLGGKPLRQVSGELATIAQTVVSTFTLDSTLYITPTSVQHSLSDINFTPESVDIVIPIGGLKADAILQRPTATVSAGGALALGDHEFSLAFGSHAWQAINLASTTLYGGDLSILATPDCGAIARAVAAKCISGTTCVGHASELENACKSGLNALVEGLRAQVTPLQLGVVRFASGSATLVDDGFDGIAERIVDGTWDAETDTGAGPRRVTATFLAHD